MKHVFLVFILLSTFCNASLCFEYFTRFESTALQRANLSQQATEILEMAVHTLTLPGRTIEEQTTILAEQMQQMHDQIAGHIQNSSDKILKTPVRSLEKMTSESNFMGHIKDASRKLTEIRQQGLALESSGVFRSAWNKLRGLTIGRLEQEVQTLEGLLRTIISTSKETSDANLEQMKILDEANSELSEFRISLYERRQALGESIPEIELFLDARLIDNPNREAIKNRVLLDLKRQFEDTQDMIALTNSLIANNYELINQKRAALVETQRRLQTVPIHIRHLLISEVARLGTVRQIEANDALDRMTTAAIKQQAEGVRLTQKALEDLSSRRLFSRESLEQLEQALLAVEQSRAAHIKKQLDLIRESESRGQELVRKSEELLESSRVGKQHTSYFPKYY